MQKINLAEAFARIDDCWNPRIAGQINDTQVKLVKLSGAFDWHHHPAEDEMFLVIEGRLRMRLRDGDVDLGPGEFLVVPHGVEHCPVAVEEPCCVLLVEPGTTLNTGTEVTERTRAVLERIDQG